MSLVGPKASNPTLTIEFNTRVSEAAYGRARDEVLLTRGVKFLSEDEEARTMKVEAAASNAQATIENIPGVEKVTRQQQSGGNWRQHRL